MNNKLPIISLILIVPLIIASWLLVHILAVFGIFLAVAYPLWWIFAPNQTVCFLCRAEKDGAKCPFCRQQIIKNQGVSPKSLFSAIFNGVLIFIFSIVSIGVVFGESQLLFKLGFPPTPKTVSFIIPTKGQYRIGEIFPMKVEIIGIKTPVNAIQADLGFNPSKLEVVDVSTNDSFAEIFIQKEINNQAGYVRLTGGLPNPGFSAERGVFGKVLFKGKEPGIIKVEFLPSSMVLANDGRGTDVLKDLATVSYFVLPERITEAEEKMQKEAFDKDSVLGENTENVKMRFYEENQVLGESTEKEIKSGKKINIIDTTLGWLEEIDRLILNQWAKVF